MAKTATKSRSKATAKSSSTKSKSVKAKSTTAKAKKTATKSKTRSKAKTKSTESVEVLNETGNRATADDRRKEAAQVSSDRRKTVRRRRQIDPTTCERDYSDQEIQFMHAMDEYKQLSGRMFPTCSEILEVLTNLGYRQIADAKAVYDPNAEAATTDDECEDEVGNDFESCI